MTRANCPLCDDARPIVERVARRFGASVQTLDVDADPALAERFGTRVPVVLGQEGAVLAEGHFAPRQLRRALRSELG